MTRRIFGGSFQGTTNIGGSNTTSDGEYDGYVCSLDADGNVIWFKKLGSTGNNSIYDVNILTDNSSIISGYFSDTTLFSGSSITSALPILEQHGLEVIKVICIVDRREPEIKEINRDLDKKIGLISLFNVDDFFDI